MRVWCNTFTRYETMQYYNITLRYTALRGAAPTKSWAAQQPVCGCQPAATSCRLTWSSRSAAVEASHQPGVNYMPVLASWFPSASRPTATRSRITPAHTVTPPPRVNAIAGGMSHKALHYTARKDSTCAHGAAAPAATRPVQLQAAAPSHKGRGSNQKMANFGFL